MHDRLSDCARKNSELGDMSCGMFVALFTAGIPPTGICYLDFSPD
jgi:hypothetical protein